MEADAISRLGEPEQVAEAAVAAYRRRSFFGRHPILTFPLAFLVFAVSPVIACYVLAFVSMAALTASSGQGTFDWHEHHAGLSLFVVLCSTFLSILYSELAMPLPLS